MSSLAMIWELHFHVKVNLFGLLQETLKLIQCPIQRRHQLIKEKYFFLFRQVPCMRLIQLTEVYFGRKLLASLVFPELRYVVICLTADLYLLFLIRFIEACFFDFLTRLIADLIFGIKC